MNHRVRTKFLQELDQHIETHLSDQELSIEKLLRMIGMSRSNLHRYLENAVRMSATAYLRNYRLRKAAKLLISNPELTVCQVSLEVGFGTTSYFSRRFREKYGCTPSEFRKAKDLFKQVELPKKESYNNTIVPLEYPFFNPLDQIGTYVIFFISYN